MVLMEPANVIQRPVSIIFKGHGDQEEVPVVWKAKPNPIFKKGGSGSFRLVHLTAIPGKVIEQILLEAISSHMKNEKVVGRSQNEFTKGKSRLTKFIPFYN